MSLFRCPACGRPLVRGERTYRCPGGHCYDIAKEGYTYLPQWLFALPLTALFALVLGDGSNYWWVAAAIQGESILKVPLCMLRCRKPVWIHDVTIPEGEEP